MDTATVELIIKAFAESGTAEKIAWIWFYAQVMENVLCVGVIAALCFLGYRGIKAIEAS